MKAEPYLPAVVVCSIFEQSIEVSLPLFYLNLFERMDVLLSKRGHSGITIHA